ncbi:MAG: hypothetical protein QOG80_1619 [Pseudonocardiales bacterium]|nr:hypothetical protein [Pseudonocardiales bacterium]
MGAPEQHKPPSFAGWLGSMWLYTLLRFGLFLALWGLLVLVGLQALIGALVAALISVPLSLVLLAAPRAKLAANIEARVAARQDDRAALDAELAGEDEGDRAD